MTSYSGVSGILSNPLLLPMIKELVSDGIDYGTLLLVEFEPHSCWYDAALTIAAEALRDRIKTDLHIFQRMPDEISQVLLRFGLDVKTLREEDTLRIIDSYTVQTGIGVAEKPKEFDEVFETQSVKVSEWSAAAKQQVSEGIANAEKRRLHIDDNLTVITRYNEEGAIIDYWRTRIIPLYRIRQSVLINALCLGVASDNFYSQFESLADGIIDFKIQEEGGVITQLMRVRVMRGKIHDSRWHRLRTLETGKVVMQELVEPAVPSRRSLAAIMFSDIVGYTALAQRNEALALRLLEEHNSLLRSILPRYHGREVKTIGDSFLIEFGSALEATQCAIEIQRAIHERNWASRKDKLQLRIGIHVGDIVRKNGDVLGDAVNVASRIEPLAHPGCICITQQVYDHVRNKIERPIEKLGPIELKNVKLPIEIYKITLTSDTD